MADSFRDALDAIRDVDVQPKADPEEEVTPEKTPEEGTEVGEQPQDGEAGEEEVEVETPDDDPADKTETPEGEEEPEPKVEKDEGGDDGDDEPTFEIDGETVTLSELREWKKSGLREGDYTKKTMHVADLRKDLEAKIESVSTLAKDIAADPDLQKFLAAHPEGIEYLMAKPEVTRMLIGNQKDIEEFWEDYEAVLENPRLASKLVEGKHEEVQQEMTEAKVEETIANTILGLSGAIHHVAQDYPEVDTSEIVRGILEMAGAPEDMEVLRNSSLQDRAEVAARLYQIFYRHSDEEGVTIDPRIIRSRFDAAQRKLASKEPKKPDSSKHNEEVRQALKSGEAESPSPTGTAPAATPEVPEINSIRDALDAFRV